MLRLQNLREKLVAGGLDGILIGSAANRRYLSRFTGSDGWLVISQDKAIIAIDFRYVEQAKQETANFQILHIKGAITGWLPELIKELGVKKLGIESDHMPVSIYHSICESVQQDLSNVHIVPVGNFVESLRTIKDDEEMEYITEACRIADRAMLYSSANLRAGISEKEFALELEHFIRQQYSESLPFEIIAASGPNSALPHAKPTDRLIAEGEPVTLDLGARCHGYCSDITRTFVIGKGDNEFYKIYNAVLTAQLTALSVIKTGESAAVADERIRDMIVKMGYGELFGHGLGHGVGLETHELPRIGLRSEDVLAEGMVFTIEPGIYIPGWGGVRIEDTVAIAEGKIEPLTKASKEALIGR